MLFEEWRTPADLWEWTGGRLSVPRLLPGTEELVEELVITHYESLDVDSGDIDLRAITNESAVLRPGKRSDEAAEAASP